MQGLPTWPQIMELHAFRMRRTDGTQLETARHMPCVSADAPRVLIADDQSDVLDALSLLFRPEGIHTETVQSPSAVLSALSERDFDVLLMDLNYARDTTSGREGLDLLSQVREVEPSLPVVVMTGWATLDIAVEALRNGVRDFVQKPWENDRILACVRRHAADRRTARAEAARRARELDEAREIQRGLLPQALPTVDGWEVAAACEPAEVVGGDTFDVIQIDRHRLGLSLGDASGKGVPAALLASNLQAAVRSAAGRLLEPADLCAHVNRALCDSMTGGHFITFFYGVLDTTSGELRYCNAGHLPPILASADGRLARLETGGMVLGIAAEAAYREGTVALGRGDRLLIYTDGLTEARSPDGEEFAEDGLRRALAETSAGAGGKSLVDGVLSRVRAFCGGPREDAQTLLVICRDPGAPLAGLR